MDQHAAGKHHNDTTDDLATLSEGKVPGFAWQLGLNLSIGTPSLMQVAPVQTVQTSGIEPDAVPSSPAPLS